jgi:hypothetical protein
VNADQQSAAAISNGYAGLPLRLASMNAAIVSTDRKTLVPVS